MASKKNLFFPLLLFAQCLIAQNINGFQIFVQKDQLTSITFHSPIDRSVFAQMPSPYGVIIYGNTISVRTDKDVKIPCNLTIYEGDRIHKFVVTYMQDFDQSFRDLDYSDLNKLKIQIKNFTPTESNTSSQNNVNPVTDSPKPVAQPTTVSNDINNTNVYRLIDEGDQAKKNGQVQIAKEKYQQALQIQPDNGYAQSQLKTINDVSQKETDTKYNDAIKKANDLIAANNYDEAIKYINAALVIKPKDSFAANLLSTTQKNADAYRIEQANIQKESSFNFYIKTGDKALLEKSYASAIDAYNEALKIKPGNKEVLAKMNSLHQKIISDSIAEEHEKNENLFTSFLNAANSALKEKSYEAAKLSFIEALKLKPNDAGAKSKLNSLNQLMYSDFCNQGNEALKRKAYDEAKDFYNQALKIKPNDAVAISKLSFVDKQKLQDEADNSFTNYITSGDKAVNEKHYSEAEIAYKEALKIKPGDITTKTKLNFIAQAINNDSLALNVKKNEDLYAGFIAAGNTALNDKLYDEAKLNYDQALKIKPGDAIAKEKIELINNTLFDNFLHEGDDAFSGKQYNKATDAYNAALKIKPGDASVKNKLAQVEKEKKTDDLNETYSTYIIAGDKAFNDKSYTEARISYASALKLKPNDSSATAKINLINQRIALDSTEKEQARIEASFKDLIDTAGLQEKNKKYRDAILYYNQALKLKPGNEYVLSKIKNVQQLTIQSQKDSTNNANTIPTIAVSESNNMTSVEKNAVSEIENSMVLIKARLFKMGSNVGSADEGPVHIVKLDSFYMGKFEVTQSQWQSIMGNNPSFFKNCDDCPVENVSWNDAMKFIERLNQLTGKHFRLPTEAEWEYVAGTQNAKEPVANVAWYNDNSTNKTHHIGLLKPVYLGVYDMFGNVEEWCSDWYSFSAYGNDLVSNPTGPAKGKEKVYRGGSWHDFEGAFRRTVREKASPDKGSKKIGFRLVSNAN